jgi:WD40 repeat protein
MPERQLKYNAFISYSHAADGRLAPALQRALHRFCKRWNQLRALRVFRDETSLSMTPELWPSIERALSSSEFFLLLASPQAAQSRWVGDEISWWLMHRESDSLLLILTDGEIVWNRSARDFDWNMTTALPYSLHSAFANEPLYVDLRWAKTAEKLTLRQSSFRAAVLDVASPLHHKAKDELDGEDIREFRKTLWIKRFVTFLLVTFSLIAIAFGIAAERQRRAAQSTAASLLQEQGRQELVAGNADRALAYFRNSVELGGSSPVLRFLVTHAARRLGIERQAIDLHAGAVTALAVAPHDLFAAVTHDGIVIHTSTFDRMLPVKDVRAVSLDSQGLMMVSLADDTAIVWSLHSCERIATLPVSGRARSADVSPYGDRVVIVADDVASIWPIPPHGRDPIVLHHDGDVNCVEFSPDGTRVATASWDRNACVWNVSNGQRIHVLPGHDGDVTSCRWSADGRLIVTCSADNTARIWDGGTGELLRTLNGHSNTVTYAHFSLDGERLVTASRDGTARIWDLNEGGKSLVLKAAAKPVVWAEFDREAKAVLTLNDNGSARLWDATVGEELEILANDILAASISRDGKYVTTAGSDGQVRIWDVNKITWMRALVGHTDNVLAVVFSPSGLEIATGSNDHTACIWNASDDARTRVLTGHRAAVRALAFSPDGRRLATGDAGGEIRLWRVDDGTPTGQRKMDKGGITWIGFDGSGKHLITAAQGGGIHILDNTTLEEQRSIACQEAPSHIVLAPHGEGILAWSPHVVQVWGLTSEEARSTINMPKSEIIGADYGLLPDNIVIATREGEVRLLRLQSATPFRVLTMPGPLIGLSSSLDHRLLAVSQIGFSQVRDMQNDRVIGIIEGTRVTFSADGEFMLSMLDQTAVLWSIHPVRILAKVGGHSGPLVSALFDPRGESFVTQSSTEAPRVWRMWPDGRSSREILDSLKGRIPWRIADGSLVPAD